MKLVQFGAGNIGRSFIGQIFSRAGWEVVFVDVNEHLVKQLNEKQYYTVVIKREGQTDEVRRVGPVRAVNGQDAAAELVDADITATSVGKNALPKVLPIIADGLKARYKLKSGSSVNGSTLENPAALAAERPLDIILAENDREAPALCRSVLTAELGPKFPLDKLVGLVETSVGKMVPIMKAADLATDPLLLFAEEYEKLIVDANAFRNPLPNIPELRPVHPIAAYVDRKLFIHNLGHAAAAYLGCAALAKNETANMAALTIPEVLPNVEETVRRVMNEAADALVLEYPENSTKDSTSPVKYGGSYSREDVSAHIENLIFRFKNHALGDTVHRVGRDLRRKLAREDRITGAMLLCAKHGLPFGTIAAVYRAALEFAIPAENGALFPADEEFRKLYRLDQRPGVNNQFANAEYNSILKQILQEVSGLDSSQTTDASVIKEITEKCKT